MRDSFTKGDKLKDFLADNKDYKIKMMFVQVVNYSFNAKLNMVRQQV